MPKKSNKSPVKTRNFKFILIVDWIHFRLRVQFCKKKSIFCILWNIGHTISLNITFAKIQPILHYFFIYSNSKLPSLTKTMCCNWNPHHKIWFQLSCAGTLQRSISSIKSIESNNVITDSIPRNHCKKWRETINRSNWVHRRKYEIPILGDEKCYLG